MTKWPRTWGRAISAQKEREGESKKPEHMAQAFGIRWEECAEMKCNAHGKQEAGN